MKDQAPRPLTSTKIGTVTSDKRNKTRTVIVEFLKKHPKYGKYVKCLTRLNVHDENNVSHVGDRVEVVNCRPLSKTKSWRLVRVVTQAPGGEEPAAVAAAEPVAQPG